MNERIKEFRFKAAEYTNEQKPLGITKWNEMRDTKFAELIVRECARICDELQDIPATEPRHCAEDIRIHFGVKE